MGDVVTENTQGAVDEMGEKVDDFWVVLDADDLDEDTRAEITQLMEGVEDNIGAIKKILKDLAESE